MKVGRFPFIGNGKAIALGETEGLVKTVFDAKTGELLGAHMVGAEVTELSQSYVIARTKEAPEGDLSFTCPRCQGAAEEVAYGPCSTCRAELRGLGGEQRDVVEEDYVPKMNVTPNAVALKD